MSLNERRRAIGIVTVWSFSTGETFLAFTHLRRDAENDCEIGTTALLPHLIQSMLKRRSSSVVSRRPTLSQVCELLFTPFCDPKPVFIYSGRYDFVVVRSGLGSLLIIGFVDLFIWYLL